MQYPPDVMDHRGRLAIGWTEAGLVVPAIRDQGRPVDASDQAVDAKSGKIDDSVRCYADLLHQIGRGNRPRVRTTDAR